MSGCARHPYWVTIPPPVANQINWNSELYAAGATVSRSGDLLRGPYRRLIGWFADGITRPSPGHRTTNLGPSYAFHYLPERSAADALNGDVPEYANIVVEFIQFYDHALRVGMRPLPDRSMRLLRAWVQRLVAGSWTHAGMMNWDTGYGRHRWMSAQYWAFAQQGLLAIAASPRFRSHDYGRWAKAIFDRGLMLHRRFEDAGGGLAEQHLYGIHTDLENQACYCMRFAVSAARAVALGLGDMPAEDPPPLYAYDFDTGRLAVTTPNYSTAIVPGPRGRFRYGGIELARLFGPDGEVAANVGGTPPAAFGIVVDDRRGHTVLASQHVRARPLRILKSPRGRIAHPRHWPARPYAGPFRTIKATGTVARHGVRIRSTYRFSRAAIVGRWEVRAQHRARALFPTWGASAAIVAIRRNGTRVRLAGAGTRTGTRLALSDVVRLELGRGDRGGYGLVPLQRPAGATLVARTVAPQPTNPRPGPTLQVELGPGRAGVVTFAVRLVPRG